METGTLVRWGKKEGDKVEPGDLIAEVETDKATIGWEATEEGVVARLLVSAPAKGLAVGSPVLLLTKNAADAAALKNVNLGDLSAASASAPAAAAPSSAPAAPAAPSSPAAAKSSVALPQRILRMPALSPTMEKGTLAKWAKQPGDKIEPGDLIAEVETDKATIGWESTEEGFMAKTLVSAGSVVTLGTPVAILADKKDEVAKWQHITQADLAGASAAPVSAPSSAPAPSTPSPAASAAAHASAAPAVAPTPSASSSERVFASPRARMEAAAKGVSLAGVRGTGPNGRIIAADVREYVPPVTAAAPAAAAAPVAAPAASVSSSSTWSDSAVSGAQATWAARVLESKQRVPHFYLTTELHVDALERAVAQLQGSAPSVSLTAAIVLAAARASQSVPAVNSEWRGDAVRRHAHVDVNLVLAGAGGVAVPVVRQVEQRGLRALSEDMVRVTKAATSGALSAADSANGTLSVLDLGASGVLSAAPIVLPSQACALALGSVETRAVLDADGTTLKKVRVLTATLACDHRVVDGAVGAQWLQSFKALVEQPLTLLL